MRAQQGRSGNVPNAPHGARRRAPSARRAGPRAFSTLAALLLVLAAPAADSAPPEAGQVLGSAVHALGAEGPTVVTTRVPLVEVFTATWCPPCAPADRALDRLLDERAPAYARSPNGTAWPEPGPPATVAVLAYHPHPDLIGEDRFGIPEGQHRLTTKHGAFWFPSVYVDGFLEEAARTRTMSVDAGMEEVLLSSYRTLLFEAERLPPAVAWNITATTEGRNVTIIAQMRGQDAVNGPVYIQGALWEDHIRFAGSNGIDDHRMTVRALLPRHVTDGVQAGATSVYTWTVELPAGVDAGRAGITLFAERAWTTKAADDGAPLMTFALGTAAIASLAVVALRVRRQGGSA